MRFQSGLMSLVTGENRFAMKTLLITIILTLLLPLTLCSRHPLTIDNVIYNPPVVFAGYVNKEYDSLPGNLTWPNTCELLHDTLRMHFYSESFHVADKIWYGDLLILTLLPDANDSLISTRSVFLHMARYIDMNYSYDVTPADSDDLFNNRAEMRALNLSRIHGAAIGIDKISVLSTALTGNTDLVITDGRIFGTVP